MELGCGHGDVIAALAMARPDVAFRGLDVEPDMIEHARRAHRVPNLTFGVADVAGWSPDLLANLVFVVDVVHHVRDVDALIRTVDRLLAPSGRWIVIEPNIFHPFMLVSLERMRRAGLDEDHFRPWRFEPRVRAAGLRIDERRTAFAVPGGSGRCRTRSSGSSESSSECQCWEEASSIASRVRKTPRRSRVPGESHRLSLLAWRRVVARCP